MTLSYLDSFESVYYNKNLIPISAAFNRSLMHLNGAIFMKFITNSLFGYIKIKQKKATNQSPKIKRKPSQQTRTNEFNIRLNRFTFWRCRWRCVQMLSFRKEYPLKMISQQKQTTVFTVIDLRCHNNISFWALSSNITYYILFDIMLFILVNWILTVAQQQIQTKKN